MNRFVTMFAIVVIVIGVYSGVRYIGSIIHYNCVYVAEDCAPPIKGVGELGWYLTGGSLIPLWNKDATTVIKVNWSIEKANPQITSEDDYRINEQQISADVTTLDGATKRYDHGTAYGCTGETMEVIEDGKLMLGKVECYYALTGVRFAAFSQNSAFRIE